MINESNNAMDTILSSVSQEQIEHHKFMEELDKKNQKINWYWKMLGVTVVIAVVWITITSWWFNSGEATSKNEKRIQNPHYSPINR